MIESPIFFILGILIVHLRATLLYMTIPVIIFRKLDLKRVREKNIYVFLLVIIFYLAFYGFFMNPIIKIMLWVIFFIGFYYYIDIFTGNVIKAIPVYAFLSISTYPLTYVVTQIISVNFQFNNAEIISMIIDLMYCLQYIVLVKVFLSEGIVVYQQYMMRIFNRFKVVFYAYLIFEFLAMLLINWKDPGHIITIDMNANIWFPVVVVLLLVLMAYLIRYLITITEHLNDQVTMQKYYVQSIEELYDEIRRYKHDINNILLPIGHFIEEKNYESLEVYYNANINLHKSLNVELYKIFAQLIYLKIPELKGLILSKYQWAKQESINLSIGIQKDIINLGVDIVDLCRMVGILLDNAIEGAGKVENGYIHFDIQIGKEETVLEITNNYDIKTLSVNPTLYPSLKGKGRGIGLKSLVRVIKRYPNIELSTYISSNEYRQVLSFKNINEAPKSR